MLEPPGARRARWTRAGAPRPLIDHAQPLIFLDRGPRRQLAPAGSGRADRPGGLCGAVGCRGGAFAFSSSCAGVVRGLVRRRRRRPRPRAGRPIAAGRSTLILAPTGSGKTLAAFLWCLDRLMFAPAPAPKRALPRALRLAAQGAGGRRRAQPARAARRHRQAARAARRRRSRRRRSRSAPATRRPAERARFQREPADILITTPESLYLLLTSNAREALRSVDTVIIDEIHALVPTKRGAHLALSLERLRRAGERPLQRIGLSATQRPLDEVARFLGGVEGKPARTPAPATPPAARRARPPRRAAAKPPRRRRERAAPTSPSSEIARRVRRQPRRRRCRHAPVTIVDAGTTQGARSCAIEVPVEDMARLDRRRSTSRAGRRRRDRRGRRSGRPSIRACSS